MIDFEEIRFRELRLDEGDVWINDPEIKYSCLCGKEKAANKSLTLWTDGKYWGYYSYCCVDGKTWLDVVTKKFPQASKVGSNYAFEIGLKETQPFQIERIFLDAAKH